MAFYGKVITMSKDKDMEEKDSKGTEETQRLGQPEEAKAPAAKVRDKEKAKKDIERHLAKKSVWHTENEVSDTVDALYSACEANGTVPTREAFAAMCVNPEIGECVKGMGHDPFTEKPLNKKAIALAAVAVLAVACIGVAAVALQPQGGSLPVAGSSSSASSSSKSESAGSKSKKTDSAASSEDKAESKDKDDKSASSSKESKDEKGADSSSKKEDKGANSSKPASSQQQAPAAKPSGNGGGQASSKPSQPAHTHSWVHHDAVYQTVHHDAVYNNVWHDPVYESVTICIDCGMENPGRDHMYQHAINGGSGATTVEQRLVQAGYNEQVLVSGAWDEQVLVSPAYDSCACGATK